MQSKKSFFKGKRKRKIVSLSIHIIPPIIHNGWIERRTHFFLFLLNHFFSPLPPQTKQSRAVITTPPHPNFSLQPPSHLSPPTHSAGLSNPNSIDPAAYHLRPTPAPGPGPGPRLNKGQTSCFPLMQKFKKGEEEKNRESEKGKKKKTIFLFSIAAVVVNRLSKFISFFFFRGFFFSFLLFFAPEKQS